jgi:hypothetical protein
MTSGPPSISGMTTSAYWYTVRDCQKILGVSRATVFRHLARVPLKDRVKVKRRVSGQRNTRYWRISPDGLRVLGHSTGQAPYL